MKSALLLSGHIRSVEKTIKNLLNLKEKINADIFIHTWSEKESTLKSWRQYEKYDENIDKSNKYIKLLKPKSLLIENPTKVTNKICKKFNIKDQEGIIKPIFYQLYGINSVFELMKKFSKKNDISYSSIIRYRFDLYTKNLDLFKKDLNYILYKKSQIIMMDHNWCSITNAKFDGIIMATMESYDEINSLIKSKYYTTYIKHDRLGLPIPEVILTNLIREKYPLIKSCSFDTELIRDNKELNQNFKKKRFPALSEIISLCKINIYTYYNRKDIVNLEKWNKLYIKDKCFFIKISAYIVSKFIIFKNYILRSSKI